MFWRDLKRRDRSSSPSNRIASVKTADSIDDFGFNQRSMGGNHRQRYLPIFDDLTRGTIVEQWLPKDEKKIHKILRGIYDRDSICGPAIDFYKELPWSSFNLVGVDDKIRQLYEDACSNLEVLSWLPDAAGQFLTLGKLCAHFLLDEHKGIWEDVIIHDPDYIEVTPIPTVKSEPKIDLKISPEWRAFLRSTDPRDMDVRQHMLETGQLNENLVTMIMAGKSIPLDPAQTLYLPRKSSPYDWKGSSIYLRVLNFLSLEYSLINASISGARRRAGPILHVKMGSEAWEPDITDLDQLRELFMQAEEDPVNPVITTRYDVEAAYITGANEIWKIRDEWDFLSQAKMRALGVSETFLSGEATYNTMEAVMSIFLERIKAFRDMFTQKLILQKILAPLAINHGFFKRTPAQLAHRIRVASHDDYSNLLLPQVVWSKPLKPHGDEMYLEILQRLEEKGLPVTLRTWASAGGYDLDTEMQQMASDVLLRKRISKYRKQIQGTLPLDPDAEGGGFEGGGGGGFETEPFEIPEEPLTEPIEEAPAPAVEEAPPPPETAPATELPGASFNPKSLKRGDAVNTKTRVGSILIEGYEHLPLWREGSFLELPQGEAVRAFNNMMQHSESPKSMYRAMQQDLQARKWSPPKRELFYYTLARVGMFTRVELSSTTEQRILEWITHDGTQNDIREMVRFSKITDSIDESSSELTSFVARDLSSGARLLTGC
jgi:hypothetical protein